MIATIAKKETLEMVRDGRFRWATISILLLLLVAFLAGWSHYARLTQQRDDASASERTVWTTQQDKNPHSAAHYGTWAFKPITPLTVVDRGVTSYTGTALFMEGHAVQDAQYRPVDDATGLARLGELTAAVTLQWLVPLLIILLAFGAFAGERHQGTLRQLVSLGVAPRTIAAGKAFGLLVPLAVLLVPASLIGAAALLFGPSAGTLDWSFPRLLVLAGVYLGYFAVVVGLTLTVSALASTPRTALLVLLAFWFANAFVAPRLANDAAKVLQPGPDAAAFAERKELIKKDSMENWDARGKAITERLMTRLNLEKPEDLPVNVDGINLLESEARETAGYRALFQEMADEYEAQNAIVQRASVLAPLLAVQSLSMALTGTDYAHHRHFAESAEDYRLNYVQTLNRDVVLNARPGAEWDGKYKVGRAFWESMPAYSYDPPGLGWTLRHQVASLGMLALWLVVLLVLTPRVVRGIRVDPAGVG